MPPPAMPRRRARPLVRTVVQARPLAVATVVAPATRCTPPRAPQPPLLQLPLHPRLRRPQHLAGSHNSRAAPHCPDSAPRRIPTTSSPNRAARPRRHARSLVLSRPVSRRCCTARRSLVVPQLRLRSSFKSAPPSPRLHRQPVRRRSPTCRRRSPHSSAVAASRRNPFRSAPASRTGPPRRYAADRPAPHLPRSAPASRAPRARPIFQRPRPGYQGGQGASGGPAGGPGAPGSRPGMAPGARRPMHPTRTFPGGPGGGPGGPRCSSRLCSASRLWSLVPASAIRPGGFGGPGGHSAPGGPGGFLPHG